MWGLGILGMSRYDFYTCSIPELHKRIKGFMLRELELKNFGARRITNVILNGFAALLGENTVDEQEMWPMELDEKIPKSKKMIPKSEDLVARDRDMILSFWPDMKDKI